MLAQEVVDEFASSHHFRLGGVMEVMVKRQCSARESNVSYSAEVENLTLGPRPLSRLIFKKERFEMKIVFTVSEFDQVMTSTKEVPSANIA